jgi:anti-anti-sigma factor
MKNEEMTITEEKITGGARLFVKGYANFSNSPELQSKLDEKIKNKEFNIVLNMSQVEYISSAGIKAILKAFKETKNSGGDLTIEEPSENVRNILSMTALNMLIAK